MLRGGQLKLPLSLLDPTIAEDRQRRNDFIEELICESRAREETRVLFYVNSRHNS